MTPERLAEGRALLEAARQTYRHVCILPGNPAERAFVRDAEAFGKWAKMNASDLLAEVERLTERERLLGQSAADLMEQTERQAQEIAELRAALTNLRRAVGHLGTEYHNEAEAALPDALDAADAALAREVK